MGELTGWLLDLYEDEQAGVVLWFAGDDGERYRLRQRFPITFYAAAANETLRSLWQFLRQQPVPVTLARQERQDLFREQPLTTLAIEVHNPAQQPRLFAQLARRFPEVDYYDADVQLSLRYAAKHNVFSTGRCQVFINDDNEVQSILPLESAWDMEPSQPHLRVLSILPDCDPRHAAPASLTVQHERLVYHFALQPARPLLVNLAALLRKIDPDLILTGWGDTWLIPHLLELAAEWKVPLPLNREPGRDVLFRKERSYFSYGQVIYRGQQAHLFGRLHVDIYNAVMYHDYGLEGIWELARVTALPVQTTARVSPGTGISSMQILTALRRGILVPWHKQQAEAPVSALDLLHADQGGLVYQPLVGLHRDVAEIDFISMYPSIMARFNISPETIGESGENCQPVAALHLHVNQERRGLVPQTLAPLLEKRIALKRLLLTLPRWHPQGKVYKARANAHKWLLVTCFGYLGYKNARFGRIEAHEAVTAYGRELLLQAKEIAEDMGYTILHMYVDGLWVQKEGCNCVPAIQPLLDAVAERTGLPISLDGIYRWIVFLPSRLNRRVPVANRYFGVYQDGTVKARGIEARRHDTPPFIAQTQTEMLNLLAQAQSVDELSQFVPAGRALLQRRLEQLKAGDVALEQLLVVQTLSREVEEYKVPSPVARAVMQLKTVGKEVIPGQRVRFLYTLGEPGVYAWDLPAPPNPKSVHLGVYCKLLLAAGNTLLQPLGEAGCGAEGRRQLRLFR